MDEGTSQEGPSASIKSGDMNQTSNDDTADGISLERSSASGSSAVDDTTPSLLSGENVTGIENLELELNESMDEGIPPGSPSASIESRDKNSEPIGNSVGEGESLVESPAEFLQPSTSEVDKNAGGNAPAIQEEINEQNAKMREKTLDFEICPSCFRVDRCCQCTGVNAKETTGSKNGFKDGVKPPGPASRRNKGGKYTRWKQMQKMIGGHEYYDFGHTPGGES